MKIVQKEVLGGMLAEYKSAAEIYKACERVRDAGYTRWDAHTPFPVHGLDGAMGLKPTPIGWISLAGGALGLGLATLMQWWMGGVDYAINIGGKPAFSLQTSIPIMFELTILLTAFFTVFGMLALNKLPTYYHWVFGGKTFARVTDDRFFISIEADDPKFSREDTRLLLERTHAASVEEVMETVEERVVGDGAHLAFEAMTGVSAPGKAEDAR
ncbi:MAG: DUF3341 domain-containing protein [Dehalococcoidia bacterium]|nr:DUF3341 domain-containing protein [Dehalococcoidia bacterium]